MANSNNILIQLANGQHLDYTAETDLGIKLNRIVDDFIDPSKRYGEFSYTFSLPKTKNNDLVFEFPDSKGRIRVFNGKTFACDVYNNNQILLSGIIELTGTKVDSYECRFYSKLTQFTDTIKGKKMNDMTYLPTIPWQFEKSIANHIRVAPISSHIEFPFCFYRTPFISGGTQVPITTTRAEINLGQVYNWWTSSSVAFNQKNPMYQPAFPPAIYLKSMMDGLFADAGWSYNSSFFNRSDIQRIIVPFTGGGEDFTGAITTGHTGNTLNLNKLLPKMNQSDFLKMILNTFNLYMIPDQVNKNMVIETYNTLFSDNSNPYPITVFNQEKIYLDTANLITTKDDKNNNLALGFNRIFDYSGVTNVNPSYFLNTCTDTRAGLLKTKLTETYNKEAYTNLWNKTTGTKEIKLNLSPTNYYPYTLVNDHSIFNATTTEKPYWTIGIPLISPQTPSDNNGNDYSEGNDQDYVQGNDPSKWSYDGGFKMLYYYGKIAYQQIIATTTAYKDWIWVGLATGGTITVPTFAKVPICLASPFILLDKAHKDALVSDLNNIISKEQRSSEAGAEIHSILLTYYGAGTTDDTHVPTSFSLTFGENPIYDNIYTTFHQKKYDDFENSYILKGNMRMDENDWDAMQINRPLIFDGELYKLVSIKNYDPINRYAEIELIKKTS